MAAVEMPPRSPGASTDASRDGGALASLDEADRRVAAAAAAARAETVRVAAEARAKSLRAAARDRIRRRARALARDGAANATGSRTPNRASGTASAEAASHDTRVRPRTLVLIGLVVALVAGLVGGVVGGAVVSLFGGSADARGSVPVPAGAVVDEGTLQAAAHFASPSVVSLRVTSGSRAEVASGIVLSDAGYVLTNAHVVTFDGTVDDAQVRVTVADGRVFDAEVIGLDPLADLAVVQLDGATDLVPATFGDSDTIDVGQATIVLGAPLGLSDTVTSGVVSTRLRSIEIASSQVPESTDTNVDPDAGTGPSVPPGGSTVHLAVFQTDAAINPGNSGGPVVDAAGQVIGIAVAIATTTSHGATAGSAGSIGIGFAIPGNIAKRIANDLIEGRTPSHGAFGASVMSSTNVTTSGPTVVGAYIDSVTAGGAAHRAGLGAGDIITQIEGMPVRGPGDLLAFARLFTAGDEVEVTLTRDGESHTKTVTLDSAA